MKNKETLAEASERLYPNRESFLYRFQDIERKAFIEGAKWQAERSYSEEEVLKILKNRTLNLCLNMPTNKILKTEKWFEQFKKPNTWYNEEQTNKRMNVIGQNGNDGTHYENK